MAILKAVNPKRSHRRNFLDTLDYAANPDKLAEDNPIEHKLLIKEQTYLNRYVYGKLDSKRQFKQYVVSLEATWPPGSDRKATVGAMRYVIDDCEQFFGNSGYIAHGWLHCNTPHPHFHLLVETCNAINGKQLSQSRSELSDFKEFVSDSLLNHGLREEILRSVEEIPESELLAGDEETLADFSEPWPEPDDACEDDFYEENWWNSGTVEQLEWYPEDRHELKEMCKIVSSGREMCRIVTKAECTDNKIQNEIEIDEHPIQKPGRVMCTIVPPGGRVMCTIVPPDQRNGRVMCTDITVDGEFPPEG